MDGKFTTDEYSSQYATADYKGEKVRFQVGTSRDYDEWMSDDGAGDSYFGSMNGADSSEAKAAMERAKEQYEQKQKQEASAQAQTQLESRIRQLEKQSKNTGSQKAAPQNKKGDQRIEYSAESQSLMDSFGPGKLDDSVAEESRLQPSSAWQQAQQTLNRSSFGLQNQTDFTSRFNPSGQSDTNTPDNNQNVTPDAGDFDIGGKGLDQLRQNAQSFADKYKLDLIGSGATKNKA